MQMDCNKVVLKNRIEIEIHFQFHSARSMYDKFGRDWKTRDYFLLHLVCNGLQQVIIQGTGPFWTSAYARFSSLAVINIANTYRQFIGVLFRSRQKVSLSESMSPFQTEN